MWLLEKSFAERLEAAYLTVPRAEDLAVFEARLAGVASSAPPKILRVEDGVAKIDISGPLTKKPDFFAWLFGLGGTTYSDIQRAIALAEADPEVSAIEYHIESPGGAIDGLFETGDAMAAAKKPSKSIASQAASAAYFLAAKGGPIEATGASASFGSIGIVTRFQASKDVVTITSTDAPNKAPDVTTEEGRATVREHLDAIHELFAEGIAAGRETSVEKVNSKFGRGGVFLAGEAKRRGMIDSIANTSRATKPQVAASSGAETREAMDLKTLKAQHPELCEQLRAEGVTQERERVSAHLILAEASGDNATAIAAIKDGSDVSPTIQAKHLAAKMIGLERKNAQDDSAAAASALAGAKDTNTNAGDEAFVSAYSNLTKEEG